MATTISNSNSTQAAGAGPAGGRLRRLSGHVKVLVGLTAVYAPPTLVLLLHRNPLAKVYLVVGIWAIEGIVWYWLDGHVINRHRQRPGEIGFSADC
jgi:hypothetical protein